MNNKVLYGLIGKKLGHSYSAKFFNEKFEKEGLPCMYELYELDNADKLASLINSSSDLRGLNVTIPYKQDVIPLIDSLTPTAAEIKAVNTILIRRTLEKVILEGHNTDAEGFQEAISPLLKGRKKALILGSGGASKAVKYVFDKLNIEYLQVSRNASSDCITYSELNENIMMEYEIIVNCTPLGMWPNVDACPPIPYNFITPRHLCFDLVYNPEMTLFMKRALEMGAEVSNGLDMLKNQAIAAYKFWNTNTFLSNIYDQFDIGNCMIKKFMARKIEIIDKDRKVEPYYFSISTVYFAGENKILRIDVTPYEKEIPGVEYSDMPLKFSIYKE